MLQLVIVVVTVLLAVPALLYWAAVMARRHIRAAPRWISRPAVRTSEGAKTDPEPPAKDPAGPLT